MNAADDDLMRQQCLTSNQPVKNMSYVTFSAIPSNTLQSLKFEPPNVRLRKPEDVKEKESPIRCICSCISEYSGTCECSGDSKEFKNETDGELLSPSTPPRRRLPVIMPRRQMRKSLNPISLFCSQGGKRGLLWNR